MKIHELHLNNFKFFTEVEQDSPLLKIDGRHLLIYGENGSGKSSIYWALYTLLECSLKEDDKDIKKYFLKRSKDSLVNIFSNGGKRAFIKAILKDDSGSKTYNVSLSDLSLKGDTAVQESNLASDFINYRVLFRLQNLKHSQENDLFPWFEDDILPYIKIGTEGALDVLEPLLKGPPKVKNIDGEDVYPTPALRSSKLEEEQKDYRVYLAYKSKIDKWNKWFREFLSDVETRANKILKDDFKYDFRIKLHLEVAGHKTLTKQDFEFKNPVVSITIPEYAKKKNVVKTPHTFLNEAKWSAIGLSIRFAIIDKRLSESTGNPIDMQVLVIDDMLIGLDMSNRDTVLDILLEKYTTNFQIILMTHDRFLFELTKRKINHLNQNNWQYLEMFEDDSDSTKPVPLIFETTSKIEKCWALFYRKELALSANTLRKAIEKLCKNYLTMQERLNRDYSIKNLHQMIVAFNDKAQSNSLDSNKLSNLIEYKDRILNPNSHYDIETPVFKEELRKAIATVEGIAKEIGIVV